MEDQYSYIGFHNKSTMGQRHHHYIYIYIFEYIPLTFYKADFLISEMRYRLLWT